MLKRARGATLIELVATIVIISIAVVTLMVLISQSTGRSADPMLQEQASAIAQAYLEEISQKRFCDPDWDPDGDPDTPTVCAVTCVTSACSGCRGIGTGWTTETRAVYDDVCDYAGLTNAGARNQNDLAITGLGQYTVNVAVIDDNSVVLGPAGGQISGGNGQVVRIDVSVTHPAMENSIRVSGFKSNF